MKKVLSILLLVTVAVALLAAPAIAKGGSASNQNPGDGVNGNQNQNQAEARTGNAYQNGNTERHRYRHQEHGAYNRYQGTYGIYLYLKDPNDWNTVYTDNETYGHIQWSAGGFAFNGYNLDIQEYTLLIFEDISQSPWEYNITILGADTPTPYGDETYLAIEGKTNIYDYSGLKIWLVPSSDLTNYKFNSWNPDTYLFEYELIP